MVICTKVIDYKQTLLNKFQGSPDHNLKIVHTIFIIGHICDGYQIHLIAWKIEAYIKIMSSKDNLPYTVRAPL